MSIIHRLRIFSLAVFFAASCIVSPARAVVPVFLAPVVTYFASATAVNQALVVAGTVLVGAAITQAYLSSTSGATQDNAPIDYPVAPNRDRPLDRPSGWGAAPNNNSQPVPPSSAALTYIYSTASFPSSYLYSSVHAACDAEAAYKITTGANWSGAYCSAFNETTRSYTVYAPNYYTPGSASFTWTAGQTGSCPAGYTVSGSTCALSNASAVQKPANGRCQVLMNVSGFVLDPQDPECAALPPGVSVTPSAVGYSGSNGQSVTTTINGDGTRTTTIVTPNADGTTSTRTIIVATPAANGNSAVITGTSTTIVNGQGSQVGTTPVNSIEFPTDYNREATQQAISTAVQGIRSDLSTDAAPALPVLPDLAGLADVENQKTTDALDDDHFSLFQVFSWPAWVPSFPASSCTPFTGTIHGKAVTWDYCSYAAMINEVIGWLLALFAGWSVLSLAFRRSES